MTSLSPAHTIGNQIGEALRLHQGASESEARIKTAEMLGLVGFPDPNRSIDSYPFELSGGLRQCAMICHGFGLSARFVGGGKADNRAGRDHSGAKLKAGARSARAFSHGCADDRPCLGGCRSG